MSRSLGRSSIPQRIPRTHSDCASGTPQSRMVGTRSGRAASTLGRDREGGFKSLPAPQCHTHTHTEPGGPSQSHWAHKTELGAGIWVQALLGKIRSESCPWRRCLLTCNGKLSDTIISPGLETAGNQACLCPHGTYILVDKVCGGERNTQ